MGILQRIRSAKIPPFSLFPEDYVRGYEDEDHPCNICIIKGMCTVLCQDMWNYGSDIKQEMNRLGRQWLPSKMIKRQEQLTYSTSDLMDMLKTITGKQAQEIYFNDEIFESIQRAQFHLNRRTIIQKNFVNKYGVSEGSGSSSSVSSSHIQPTTPNNSNRRAYGNNPGSIKNLSGRNQNQRSNPNIRGGGRRTP